MQNKNILGGITWGMAASMMAPVSVAHGGEGSGAPSGREADPYVLPSLPYDPGALEPVVDRRTMEIHHGKHHQTYVDGLNGVLKDRPDLATRPLEELFREVSNLPPAVRNHGGGHWNHSAFWRWMAPVGQGGEPSGELREAMDRDLGGIEEFRKTFTAAALQRFGSGWAWLGLTPEGSLKVTSTPNQDNPLMDVAEVRGTPLLGLDVWEHAYYLHYQNRRGDYVKAWFDVVNWIEVDRRYREALSSRKDRP